MKAYQVTTDEACIPMYAGTMADSKVLLKNMREGIDQALYYADSRVLECEIPTDKAGILAILNNSFKMKVLHTWRGTSKGGLKKMEHDDERRKHRQ